MPRGTKRYVMEFDGEKRLQCTECSQWKKFEAFRVNKRGLAGRDPKCRVCRSVIEQRDENREKNRLRVKRTQRRHKIQYKQGELFYSGERDAPERARMMKFAPIDEELSNAAARTLHALGNEKFAPEMVGVDGSTLRKIANGQVERVHMSVVGAMGKFLDEPWLEDKLMPPWNRAGDKCCRGCGTNVHPHRANGLCRLCYHRDYYGIDDRVRGRDRWSTYHLQCIGCGTVDRKHWGHGMCKRCYDRKKNGNPLPTDWRQCACGCGQRFQVTNPKRMYASGACKTRAHQKRSGGRGNRGPQATTPGANGANTASYR